MSVINLNALPAPDVVEILDFETLYARRKARLVSLYPVAEQAEVAKALALDSEPMAKILQENAYNEMTLRQRVNDATRAVMLAFSKGKDLEQLAARYNLVRQVVTPADNSTTPPTPAVMELDDSLRERCLLAYEGLSVAGPRNAYIKHARDADGRVADASAISPEPCEAVITVLSNIGTGTAPADLLAAVEAALSDEDVRPVGDRVTVQSATIRQYRIRATLYLEQGPEAEPILQAATTRADSYRSQQRRLGRDVNRTAIIAALHVEGVKKLDLIEPAVDLVLDETEAAYCVGVEIVNGGNGG
ncbi:MAG: baseplate J/gp47 family protein [Duganella sp.]